MLEGQPLDLGHSTEHRKKLGLPGDRIEHTRCNRSAGAQRLDTPRGYEPSRTW